MNNNKNKTAFRVFFKVIIDGILGLHYNVGTRTCTCTVYLLGKQPEEWYKHYVVLQVYKYTYTVQRAVETLCGGTRVECLK